MIVIFFGPPGAGKGTQANLFSKKFKIPHLSTGEMLRKTLLDNDSLSKKLKNLIDSGNLVPDNILNEIILNRITKLDCKSGFIFPFFFFSRFENKVCFKSIEIYRKIYDQGVEPKVFLNDFDIVLMSLWDPFWQMFRQKSHYYYCKLFNGFFFSYQNWSP